MACLSNQPSGQLVGVQQVSPGLRCLSSANLDSTWPKALRGRKKIEDLVSVYPGQEIPEECLVDEVLTDPYKSCDFMSTRDRLGRRGRACTWVHFYTMGESTIRDPEHGSCSSAQNWEGNFL